MRLLIIGAIVAAAVSAGGCATARAKAQAEPPSLDVPAPPPRVIVPPEPEPAVPETPTPDPEPSQEKPPRRSAPAQPRPDPNKVQKTEPPPPVVEPVKPVEPGSKVTLQQTLPVRSSELERQVREQLVKADADLSKVYYQGLNADARSQYDTARRFIKQAEQALDEKNFVFASKVAEKAAGLAASLLGR